MNPPFSPEPPETPEPEGLSFAGTMRRGSFELEAAFTCAPGEVLGVLGGQAVQPVLALLDLLVVVEDPGDVAARRGRRRGHRELDRDRPDTANQAAAPTTQS